MTRDLEYNITAQDNGVTISDYLKKQGFSHAVTVQLKKIPESILLNGKWEYMKHDFVNGRDSINEGVYPIDDVRVYPKDASITTYGYYHLI